MAGQAQHVEMHRKILLRRDLLVRALPGAVYVPFIGDGDIAAQVYADRMVYGADLDPARVATCRARLDGGADVRVADCNGWPFAGCGATFAVADFDAYAYPYDSFRSFFLSDTQKADRLVVFFTDGERQAVNRSGNFRTPDGEDHHITAVKEKRPYFNFWLQKYCLPWLKEAAAPYRVVTHRGYLRDTMLYWGAVLAS